MKEALFENSSFPVLGIDDERDKLVGIGTCTLVRINDDQWFLINAAHTLDEWGKNNPIFISLPDKEIIELPFALKTKSSTVDKLDIAVTPILGDFFDFFIDPLISSLPLYDDFPIESFKNYDKRVIFFGYPSSSSRFNIDLKSKRIKAKPITITSTEVTDISEKTKTNNDIDLSEHILAKFLRKKIKTQNGKIQKAPYPHGMSGGAVYYAYVEVGMHEDICMGIEFAGIGTEYLKLPSLLKATNKNAILSFINANMKR